ncbi:uncharacterized protein LOC110993195 [Pieris rapae]|uniref:uncharacterized protein LOC110993195 n=1 Tax=Pieris rapae TaxID=64459 RepID=UPI001E27F69A|nr:uncharacterized protein LOC110993195 [Pieris rapae]
MAAITSTPINTITRDNLTVLIRNNRLNESLEFASDTDKMETDSPVRTPLNLKPISKKLFHSPVEDISPQRPEFVSRNDRRKQLKRKLRRRSLIPDDEVKIKMAYVEECNREGYSPEPYGGMRKRVLISLFHNKEYCMDCCD